MNAIPTGDAAAIYFAEALSRVRVLSDQEVCVLQRAITRGRGGVRRWTAEDDRRLLKMHKAKIGCRQIAETLNRTENAIYVRIRDLKKAARVKR